MTRRINWVLAAVVAAVAMAAGTVPASTAAEAPVDGPSAAAARVARVQDELGAARSGRAPDALASVAAGAPARSALHQDDVRADGRVVVMVAASGRAVLAELIGDRGEIQRRSGDEFRVAVDPDVLGDLQRAAAVTSVRPRDRFVPMGTTSEGAAQLGVAAAHEDGARGAGVDIAVVDRGFDGWRNQQNQGELGPEVSTVDFCANSGFRSNPHGTAVAEIVHDVAPAARLHLICVEDAADLVLASDYIRANGIRIANASIGTVTTGVGDGAEGGQSPFNVVERDRAAGVLWVVAAGNQAMGHWSSPFRDTNGDDLHEFGPAAHEVQNRVLVPPGGTIAVFLRWDEFADPRTDLDLGLFDETSTLQAGSFAVQPAPGVPPVEVLFYRNPHSFTEDMGIAIFRAAGSAAPNVDLFVMGDFGDLQHLNDLSSVTEPATAPGAMAVGAMCVSGAGLQPFSSRGPTALGTTKPDLVAHDAVSTNIYGEPGDCKTGFTGTSAATPHVAGAAALLLGERPNLSIDEADRWLTGNARDLGPAGVDNYFGAGLLRLGDFDELPERVLSPTGNYVDQVFEDFLFRHATDAEIEHWTARLDRGVTRGEFTAVLAASDEWTRTVIDQMYDDTLGRDADDEGFRYWKGVYESGRLLSDIAALIYSSDEYFSNSGGTNRAYVAALFEAVLGRAATAEDRESWAGRLDAGEPRPAVVSELYRSGEARRHRVADLYHVLLGRGPDEGGLFYWADRLLVVDAIELASVLASSDEYHSNAQAG